MGALTITNNKIKKDTAYYAIAHLAKCVSPGSVRIHSTNSSTLTNVAFLTQYKMIVTIVMNGTNEKIDFNIIISEKSINSRLTAGSIGTYIWNVHK